MIRRSICAVGALLAAFALSSCATFTDHDNVARVNDQELSRDDFAIIANNEFAQQLPGAIAPNGAGDLPGDAARSLLTAWIVVTALQDGGAISDAARTEATTVLVENAADMYETAPPIVQDFLVGYQALVASLQSGEASTDELQAMVAGSDIMVRSTFGVWDDSVFSIVPMG